ncbi:hypothetical protein AG1IA_09708 [Rhizoctonia solani AG-1 IA]|uniref:Uncharacterized protein n=1 Tax=Thanatephorus cucumeris (strain AG1-IA) TaxID=983506 RepID=L8WDK5_THACA|nr:hypothetical protein AG1IA_09708 [Rhizoctonia solani AG-1 IA]
MLFGSSAGNVCTKQRSGGSVHSSSRFGGFNLSPGYVLSGHLSLPQRAPVDHSRPSRLMSQSSCLTSQKVQIRQQLARISVNN